MRCSLIAGAMVALVGLVPSRPVAADAALAVLHNFSGAANQSGGLEGGNPSGGLIIDASGLLYGTAQTGGGTGCGGPGCGTVFSLTTSGVLTVLYRFKGGADGFAPVKNLVFDDAGALYGATAGGAARPGSDHAGTVFRLKPPPAGKREWRHTVLYSFCSADNCADGQDPHAALVFHRGELYGTTANGGAASGTCGGCTAGEVYKLTPPAAGKAAWQLTVLHAFTCVQTNPPDGCNPLGGVTFDDQGRLYGATTANSLVYRLTPASACGDQSPWTEEVLFQDLDSLRTGQDLAFPQASLIFDSSGALYGTVYSFLGGVFKLVPPADDSIPWSGTFIHQFAGPPGDGANPAGDLVFDSSGALYGTTVFGGTNGNGTVFQLTQ